MFELENEFHVCIPDEEPLVLRNITEYARENNISDIHLEVGTYPAFRRNGFLQKNEYMPVLSKEDMEEIIAYTLKHSDIDDIKEDFFDADFCYAESDNKRYRVNAFKKQGAYGMVMRVFKEEIPTLETLNLPESLLELLNTRTGLILVVGATGSGKSSTLAALIEQINQTKAYHIITLEDPVEYVYHETNSVISQREVHKDVESFESGIRAALREDPDVILVGEMRDPETIAATLTAAETGHLVFSTLHTTSAAKTIDRIVDVFPGEKQAQIKTQLATTLRAVIAQVLIPTADGNGRVPAIEVMLVNDAISTYIRNNQKNMIESEIQTKQNIGMIPMRKSIENLIQTGRISRETAEFFR